MIQKKLSTENFEERSKSSKREEFNHTINSCPSTLSLLSSLSARRTPSAFSNSQNPNPFKVPVGS